MSKSERVKDYRQGTDCDREADGGFSKGTLPEKLKQERLRWAEMLKRVFEIDVTVCPKCSGRMEQIAVIKDKAVAKKILESLGEVTTFRPLEVTEDRGPPLPSVFQDEREA